MYERLLSRILLCELCHAITHDMRLSIVIYSTQPPDYFVLFQEVSDKLLGCYTDLVSSPQPPPLEEAQELSYVKYTPPGSLQHRDNHSIITLENRGLILSSGTTGFRTWEAALHLGTFLSTPEGQALVNGKNVVELGAGTGFISMYCIKALGASSVTATDREPALISNIQDCLGRNDLGSRKIRALTWDWGSPLLTSSESPLPFEIGLGTDLVGL